MYIISYNNDNNTYYIYRLTRFVCIAQLLVATTARGKKPSRLFAYIIIRLQFGRRRRRATRYKCALPS